MKVSDYIGHLPEFPLAGDSFDRLYRHRDKMEALSKKYIQINRAEIRFCITVDIDHSDAFHRIEESGLPKPTFASYNRASGRAHAIYLLERPVGFSGRSRIAPQQFHDSVVRGFTRRLGGDWNYSGFIAKNPFSPEWSTDCGLDRPYLLDELKDCLTEEDTLWKPNKEEWGYGRNVTLFDKVRKMSYRETLKIKKAGGRIEELLGYVMAKALEVNAEFDQQLFRPEVEATVKSITDWSWENITLVRYSASQARKARIRWGETEAMTKPWREQGCSRASWYRRRAKAP